MHETWDYFSWEFPEKVIAFTFHLLKGRMCKKSSRSLLCMPANDSVQLLLQQTIPET